MTDHDGGRAARLGLEKPAKTLGKTTSGGDVPPYVPPSTPLATHQDESEGGYFPLHDFQLDAFQDQEHPEQVGEFRMVREPAGAFDGKVFPSTDAGFAYVMGWLYGQRSHQHATHLR